MSPAPPRNPGGSSPTSVPAARGLTHHEPPPLDAHELRGFPKLTVRGAWHRAHVERSDAGDRGCWWFSSAARPPETSGRFDLPSPRGTCYLSTDEEGAARERVGTQIRKASGQESVLGSVLTDEHGQPVVVSAVELPALWAANLPVKAAQRWVNRSLWAGTGIYGVCQEWAELFEQAGFEGVRYPPRFTLGSRAMVLAVFGDAGIPTPPRATTSSRSLSDVLADHAIRVVYPPSATPTTMSSTTPPPPL